MTAQNDTPNDHPNTPSARSSSGLPVRKPLVSRSSLSPGKGLTRAKAIRRISARRKAVNEATDWPALREALWRHCKGICQGCGEPMSHDNWHCHHRLLRSRGGKHTWHNLVALHNSCHEWVHAHPEEATSLGFMLPTGTNPDAATIYHWSLVPFLRDSA